MRWGPTFQRRYCAKYHEIHGDIMGIFGKEQNKGDDDQLCTGLLVNGQIRGPHSLSFRPLRVTHVQHSFFCVCVYHLNRCKTSFCCRGPLGNIAASGQRRRCNVPVKTYLHYILYIYICIVPPLGASKSQLAGKKYIYILSLLFYTVNVYCDSIYRGSSHRVMLLLVFFACLMHSAAKFATTVLIKCVTHVGSTRCREPLGEYLSR